MHARQTFIQKDKVSTYLNNRPGRVEFDKEDCASITTSANLFQELEAIMSAMFWRS
jgi:hypothetical protein